MFRGKQGVDHTHVKTKKNHGETTLGGRNGRQYPIGVRTKQVASVTSKSESEGDVPRGGSLTAWRVSAGKKSEKKGGLDFTSW